MKRLLLIPLFLLLSKLSIAEHITGGEMYYSFGGMIGDKYIYNVTLKLFRNCGGVGAPLDALAPIAVFDRTDNAMVWKSDIPLGRSEELQLTTPGKCITNAPSVCYQVGYYEFEVVLSSSIQGYTISYQRCCRINGINNLAGSGGMGATVVANIPGTRLLTTAPANSSAQFTARDTVIVCGGYPFTYSFGASDPDPGDILRYSFCDAYVGGGQGNQPAGGPNTPSPNPPSPPPYSTVSYSLGFSGESPLGPNVTIDPNTGLISGKSPAQGIYVVTVCVDEIRNGVVIATQRKDLQIKAGGCDIAKAQLDPEYFSCDGFTKSFINNSASPLINSYYWEFGDPASGVNNSSTEANPVHTYTQAGDFIIKLVTNRNQDCSDSTTAIVRVWPGFFPAFNSAGICLTNPVLFADATTTVYGVVDKWKWDFGDETSFEDTASTRSAQWKYSTIGPKDVRLIVGNSKGCIDTLIKTVGIIEKPPITLAFRDTLICVPDAVTMNATGTGVFSWTPLTNITNAGTGTPTVNPTTTTIYHVQLNEQGCINNDSVRIRVVNFVSLSTMNDTTICATDSVQLRIQSDGLRYQWTPAAAFIDATVQNPVAIAGTSNNYQVIARIGSCTAAADINVTAIPYPVASAGIDTLICYNTPAFLNGSHDGSSFNWSPTSNMLNAGTLTPTAYPVRTTQYILTSFDTRGCPKPGRDTVLVTVLPRIRPFAGNDTVVVVGQPLQLNAEGGVSYIWTPSTDLNNATIKNPVGIYNGTYDSIRYTVQVYNEANCYDTASVLVKIFKTNPYVFVPTAFTPNGDGLNDIIQPIAVGVKQINYFSIYNRWGQLVFTTTVNGKGWDGKIAGVLQGSNGYVWHVEAIDYTGKKIFLKGTTTLIR